MAAKSVKRRTQAERRAETRQAVLDSACELFGAHGYTDTSLEQIASHCGLTIRPIYHYFGNKKALFAAVNAVMEQRIIETMHIGEDGAVHTDLAANWRAYLELCDDPAFRRIVLVDSPNVLGRERWADSPVTARARATLNRQPARDPAQQYRAELQTRVLLSALAETALMIAEAPDIALAKREAERLMLALFARLLAEDQGQPDTARTARSKR